MFLSHPISDCTSLFALCFSHIEFLGILWIYHNLIFSCIYAFVLTIFSVWNIPLSPLPCELYSSTRPSSNMCWVLWSFKLSEYLFPLCCYIIIFVPFKKYLQHCYTCFLCWTVSSSGVCPDLFFTQYLVGLSLEMLTDTCLLYITLLHNA